jgi:class 3 adenylate cyclase
MPSSALTRGATLRTKWTLAVVGVAILPMGLLGLIVLAIQREGLGRAEKELEAAVVDEGSTGIVSALDQASDMAGRTSAIFADETLGVDARSRLIGDVVGRGGTTAGVAFFDEQRHFVDAIVPRGAAVDEALKVPPVLAGQDHAFRVITLEGRPPSVRHESVLAGPRRGFLVVGLARDALGDRLKDISLLRFGAPERVYLVDESLLVLAGGSATRAGTRPVLPIFAASSTRNFATELLLTTEFEDAGVAKVGTIRTLPRQRWALVVERPTAEAFAALTSARRAFLASLAGFALVAALAGILVARRVLGPIGALMRLIQRYAGRDFDARSEVRSGDELEALGTSLERMADDLSTSEEEIEKRTRIETNLRRYMPAEAAEAAALGEGALDLGGAKRRVTVVFADVVAFTSFAESTSPERSVAFLNELFTILSEIVFRHGGMVDKFLGDCIMAVFRPSDPEGRDDVARALAAAEDMHAFVESNLPRWREAYAFTVELGIGVSTGEVLMGNLGSAARMEYTVIGDAVNVAARLESLAGPRQTLTTQEVVDACPGSEFVSLGAHALRGKAKTVEVFEVVT